MVIQLFISANVVGGWILFIKIPREGLGIVAQSCYILHLDDKYGNSIILQVVVNSKGEI